MNLATLSAAPVVTLSNGLRVANFSSPHPFTFEDGTVLPACDAERCNALKMLVHENVMNRRCVETAQGPCEFQDIELVTLLGDDVECALHQLENDPNIDVVIVPLMLMEQLRNFRNDYPDFKFRVIRMADRIKKIAKVNVFCI